MPKAVVPLSNAQIQRAKPKAARYTLHDGQGLMLEVAPNGAKRWLLRYRVPGKPESRAALLNSEGVSAYPAVSLVEARRLAEAARTSASAGTGLPQARKVAALAEAVEDASTVKAVANDWYDEKKADWAPDTARKARMVLDNYLLPDLPPGFGDEKIAGFGSLQIATLTTAQVKPALKAMDEKVPALARKGRQYCAQIVEYAIQEGKREDGRLLSLKGVLSKSKKVSYPSITTVDELPRLLAVVDGLPSFRTQSAMLLCLYTAVRPSVAAGAEWSEISLDRAEWHLPGPRMKGKSEFISPLPTQMVERLRTVHALTGDKKYVFPGGGKSGHLHRDTLSQTLRENGLRDEAVTHGFRATFRTLARERLGGREDVLEAQLAHSKRGEVAMAYDRALHLDERREIVQAWADYLDKVRKPEQD